MKIEQVWQDLTTEKVIGRGAYGTVYKCFREVDGEKVYSAVKVISIPQNDEEYFSYNTEGMTVEQTKEYYKDIVDDFTSEIKILESLKGNKNVVEIRNYHVEENKEGIGWYIFIEMELLTDFNSYSSDKTFTEEEVLKLGTDLCNALIVCNEKHIIHRDIKPENIFVSDTGDFKLGDFGVSRQMEKTYASMSRKGTFNYMAPEVFYSKKYDSRADVYSLGLVMYKLLNNNRMPFLDPEKQIIKYSERQAAFEKRINGEPIPHLKGVNSELNAVIMRACEYKAENRYSNARDMKKALEKKKLSGASGWFYRRKKSFRIAIVAMIALLAVAAVVFTAVVAYEMITSNGNEVLAGEEYYTDTYTDEQTYLYANENGVFTFDETTGETSQLYDEEAKGLAMQSDGYKFSFVSDDGNSIYLYDREKWEYESVYTNPDIEFSSVIYFNKEKIIATCRDVVKGKDVYSLILIDLKGVTEEKIAQLGDDEYVKCYSGYGDIVYLENATAGKENCVMYSYNIIGNNDKQKLASDVYACKDFYRMIDVEWNSDSTGKQYLSHKNGTMFINEIKYNDYSEITATVSQKIENCKEIIYWDENNLFFTDGKTVSRYSFYDEEATAVNATFDEVCLINSDYYFFQPIDGTYRLNRITDEGNIKAVKYTEKTAKDFDVVLIESDTFVLWDNLAKEMKKEKLHDID